MLKNKVKKILLLPLVLALSFSSFAGLPANTAHAATSWYVGSGSDGALTLAASRTEDTTQGVENITALASSGQKNITVNNGATFSVGQYVLVIQIQGTGAGLYEQAKISGIASNVLTLAGNLTNSYQSTGAEVLHLAQYSSVTINSGGSWTASGWNGTKGGVLAAMVSGNVTVNAGGAITVAGLGFGGGAGLTSGTACGFLGAGSAGATSQSCNSGDARGGGGWLTNSIQGTGGGGGGSGGSAGNTGSGNVGGKGIGGAQDSTASTATLSSAAPGAGGGGGWDTGSGNPGGAGGGVLLLISGGTIDVSAGSVSSNGNGGQGSMTAGFAVGGGGGAAGNMRFITTHNLTLGTGKVTATGGSGGSTTASVNTSGGTGATGAIATLSTATVSGTASPTLNTTSTDTTTAADPFASTDNGQILSMSMTF